MWQEAVCWRERGGIVVRDVAAVEKTYPAACTRLRCGVVVCMWCGGACDVFVVCLCACGVCMWCGGACDVFVVCLCACGVCMWCACMWWACLWSDLRATEDIVSLVARVRRLHVELR